MAEDFAALLAEGGEAECGGPPDPAASDGPPPATGAGSPPAAGLAPEEETEAGRAVVAEVSAGTPPAEAAASLLAADQSCVG